ncbi:MAG: UbiH/UbiF/VisC/COQ6 family ubiquinone biosynthesis hydroxylase [Alphaproteobacteria bacterium]|jgi:2-octaprenyl-6-methoxyphenol hydroxylase|nr:UbiH/UbiF/VisC/COQ6 family ubiquinone biosynthesis hydroxylase [Alphaproteobacteria bacterium]MBT4085042.1 UbiH/UbiF/VisC/COQ6 family ubiquinone biosynthesis hydroxylase [Alphaproteobacteria bacterium]MBT4545590.1 UbiH/UbiF/VisC/COQ6 family ubiquinone biosynthesis hydroxylase [Alphaproteobacteria bacterium]MBT6386750.1 UbiH/UbiF/VisC/COQ6 family ubiquinone biosynthesis hydroxylase [Alphaproteobacteria bacterium]MBT7745405.1 UbiH/UbiF/VisC/COQ6 family ubiquinone biosynthesis hydroxylase [Alph
MSNSSEKPENQSGQDNVDAIINGGGLVGLALGCALAGAGLRIVVIDRDDPATMLDAPYDGRSSAIAWASQQALAEIGVWSHVAERAQAMLDIRVSDGASPLFLHYDHRELDGEPFGYMVENRHMRQALHARAAELPALQLLAPFTAEKISRHDNGVDVVLSDGRNIKARLFVGAEGRRSPSREDAGITASGWSYHQVGIVCTVRHQHPHHGIAQERFLPSGPFAILPLVGNRASLVWTETDALAPVMMALDDAGFLAEIRKRFGDYLGELELEGPRWSYPLTLQIADRYIDKRLALAGDSAHGMHPIAGQGLNVGLRDVAALTEVLVDAARLGLDIGSDDVLERYQRWRRFDNATLLAVTDVLNRLFSNDIEPIHMARDIGLAAVNKMPELKKLFMRHARGTVGKLPKLLDGKPL